MKPVRLTARWAGAHPQPGQYLKSPRGRTAYEITAVRTIDPRKNAKRYGLVLMCIRHAPSEVPAGATVHEWNWDKRQKARRG